MTGMVTRVTDPELALALHSPHWYLRAPSLVRRWGGRSFFRLNPNLFMQASVRGFVTLVALVSIGACSDPTTSLRQDARQAPSAPAFDFSAGGTALGSTEYDFVVGGGGGSFSVGAYTVSFSGNSVCDPTISTYGETEWDKSCTVLADGQSIKIHATISRTVTGLAVDFTPALRFSPSAKVIISTDAFASYILANQDYFRTHHSALSAFAILYSPSLGAKAVSDFALDRSVTTHVDLNTGLVWRRVKHFSGYSVVTGESCEPSPDNPDCVEVDGER